MNYINNALIFKYCKIKQQQGQIRCYTEQRE